jgi:trehalose 6-phosphate phosphatase
MEARMRVSANRQKNSGWAFFLDFDGTLVDIAPSPESIQVPGDLRALLARLSLALGGAVAIVTGRSVANLDAYLAPLHLAIAGGHGTELRVGRSQHISAAAPMSSGAVSAVRALGKKFEGVSVEVKPSSIAVHYRSNPDIGPEIEAGLRRLLRGGLEDFVICPGRKVYEILPSHVSKGAAIEALLNFPQFQSRRPLFIGDDLSDQSGFDAAERLGGMGLRVAGEHFPKETADFDEPSEVRDWLATFAANLGA